MQIQRYGKPYYRKAMRVDEMAHVKRTGEFLQVGGLSVTGLQQQTPLSTLSIFPDDPRLG